MAKLGSTNVYGDLDVSGTVTVGVFSSVSEAPSNLEEGTLVYISGDGLYVEDGT
jgi:hypothetical protein